MRSNIDFSPYRRSSVGFDRLFDQLERGSAEEADNDPPFDIEITGEQSYKISLAVPGFGESDIEIISHQNQLAVTGKRSQAHEGSQYLHRGIGVRDFERRFQLADFVKVQSARLDHGILEISLQREIPEAMKPHRVTINVGGGSETPSEGGSPAQE